MYYNQFFRSQKLHFVRRKKSKEKDIYYDFSLWKKVKEESIFDLVKKAREENGNLKQRIGFTDFYVVSTIFHKNKQRYTGLFQYNEDDCIEGDTGINLDEKEWDMLSVNFENLEVLMDPKSTMNVLLNKPQVASFLTYRWQWVINGVVDEELSEKSDFYFSEEQAKVAGEKYRPENHSNNGGFYEFREVKLHFLPIPSDFPEATVQMRMVYYYLLQKAVDKRKVETCTACTSDCLSQVSHAVQGNCLDFSKDHVKVHLIEAVADVSVSDMSKLFDNCRKNIGAVTLPSMILAKAAKHYIPMSELEDDLSSERYNMLECRNVYEHVQFIDKNTIISVKKN